MERLPERRAEKKLGGLDVTEERYWKRTGDLIHNDGIDDSGIKDFLFL